MRLITAGLGAISSLLVALPGQAQLATQEYCDLSAFEGETLIALNSGWCHATERPFVSTYFYDEFDEQVYVVFGVFHQDDPMGYPRIGIFRPAEDPDDGLVDVVTATFNHDGYVFQYHFGGADVAPLFHNEFMSALEEISSWRPR